MIGHPKGLFVWYTWAMKQLALLAAIGIAAVCSADTEVRQLLSRAANESSLIPLAMNKPKNFPEVIACLKDEDATIRIQAAKALKVMDTWEDDGSSEPDSGLGTFRKAAVKELAIAAKDKDSKVRQEAILSIVYLVRVRQFGNHGDPYGRVRQVEPLVELGRAAVPTICKLLDYESESDELLYSAKLAGVRALRGIRDPYSIPYLIRLLRKEGRNFHYEAAWALAHFNDRQATIQIINSLEGRWKFSGSPGAMTYLKMLEQPPLDYMLWCLNHHASPGVRAAMALYFTEYPDNNAVPGLLKLTSDSDPDVRSWAAEALGVYPQLVTTASLVRKLNDSSEDVRYSVIKSLGELADPNSYDAVSELLNDEGYGIRDQVIEALFKINSQRAISDFLPLAEKENPDHLAVKALVKYIPKRMEPILLAEIKAGREDEIAKAGDILLRMGSKESWGIFVNLFRLSLKDNGGPFGYYLRYLEEPPIQDLYKLLPNVEQGKRLLVLEVLARTKDEKLLEWVLPYLEDSKYQIDAVKVIGELGAESAIKNVMALSGSSEKYLQIECAESLGKLKAVEAVPWLVKILESQQGELASYAAKSLGLIGDLRAYDALKSAAKRVDGGAVEEAIVSLGLLGDTRATNFLIEILKNDYENDVYAATALGHLGDPAALPHLRKASQSFDPYLADTALDAMKMLQDKLRQKSNHISTENSFGSPSPCL